MADHKGTSSIVSPSYPFLPHLHLLSSIVETVVHLRELGHRVVLCSSGAIGVGLRRMGLKERGKGLSHKQVCIISHRPCFPVYFDLGRKGLRAQADMLGLSSDRSRSTDRAVG